MLSLNNAAGSFEGKVNTDFDMLKPGARLIPKNVKEYNRRFRFENKLYMGTYNEGVTLKVSCINMKNDIVENDIPYRVMTVNKFKLMTDKSVSLVFGVGNFDYKGRTTEQTKLLRDLVEKTRWVDGFRECYEILEKNSNCILRTNKYGVDALDPTKGFLVVDEHDKKITKAVVLIDILRHKGKQPGQDYVRIETHREGYLAERVYKYNKGILGDPVNYKYRGRNIREAGNYYKLPVNNVSSAQWLAINKSKDPSGIIGRSDYWDIYPLVIKNEELLSIAAMTVETGAKPLLATANKLIKPDNKTGGYKLSKVEDIGYSIIPLPEGASAPTFITNANNQLEHNMELREDIEAHIYELMEMNKSFLQGSYKGNIDNDTINTIMGGCIDRAERHWWELYYKAKNSLYLLAHLNGIDISYEDIEIISNIGINKDKKEIADISTELINNKVLSKESVRIKYFGMTKEQSDAEEQQIEKESGLNEMV